MKIAIIVLVPVNVLYIYINHNMRVTLFLECTSICIGLHTLFI